MGVENGKKNAVTLLRPNSRAVLRIALIVIVYLAVYSTLDWLTHSFEILPSAVAWFPADGVSFALLLTFGAGFTPALAVAYLISAFIIRQTQLPPYILIGWSIVLPLIFGSAVLLLRHRVRFDPQLRSMRDVLWLILSSSVISAILAFGSVAAATGSGISPITGQIVATFHLWTGELIGILVLSPLLMIHVMPQVKKFAAGDLHLSRRLISFRRPGITFIGQGLSILLVLYLVFGIQGLQAVSPLYLLALPLLWISLDRGLPGISIAIPAISFGVSLALGRLYFNPAELDDLQLFMLVIYITTLLIGVARTERTRAERALEGNEKRFRALIQNNADAITLLDANGITLYDTPAAPGMLGYAPGDLIGSSAFELIHPEDLQQTIDLFKQLVQSPGSRNTTVIRLRRKDGAWLWIELIATNLLDEPSIGAVVINYRDITASKQAEERLAEERNLLRTLIDHIPDFIYVKDAQGRKTISNKADWLASGGKSMEDVLGKTDFDAYPAELAAEFWAIDKAVLDSGIPVINREEPGLDEDGNRVSILTTKVPLKDGQGNVIGLVGVGRNITERKQTEMELAARRKDLEEAQRLAHIGSWEWDIRTNTTKWSDEMYRLYDMDLGSSTFTYESYLEHMHPDDRPRAIQITEQAFKSHQPFDFEYRIYAAGGAIRWMQGRSEVIVNGSGEPIQLRGTAQDITDRKMAEQTLHESEEKYRLLFENNPLPMWVYDLETLAFLSVNDAAVGRYGYQRNEFLSMTLNDIRPAEELAALSEKLGATRMTMERSGPWKHRKKDGSLIEVETHSHEIIYDGRPGRLVLANDITEQVLAEQVLANERNLLRTLIDSLPDTIFVKDIDSRIILDNSAHQRLLRAASPEQVVGKTDFDFFPNELASAYYNDEKQVIQSGEPLINREEPFVEPDGTQKWLLTTKVPVHDQKGMITGIVGINHDITEGKQKEARIQRQLAHLTALSDIDRAITSSFGLDISLGTVLSQVTTQLSVDAASILLYNPAANTLSYTAGRGFRTKAFERAKTLRIGEGYAGQAILERRTLHIANLRERGDNPRLQKALLDEEFVSYYCVPLIAKGNVKGALEIFHRSALDPDEEWLNFLQTLAGQAAIAIDNATLFDGMQRSNVELTLAYDATIEGWSKALDLRDKETEGHTKRVTETTLRLAALFGLNDRDLVHIRRGALLHDIGKLGVPDGILLKPGPLTDEEWIAMRRHPQFAFDMLAPIQYLKSALDIPYCHHEKWDGSGYPRGLVGEQIPLTARIFAVVDVWDALTSDRPYRAAWPAAKVLEHLKSLSGSHFDPQVLRVCLESGLLKLR